ncbi:hypothetical protein E2C01_080988 [Portunus trituberculatus]|uniref:Endonuclease/exonuclease/phosphatase domain-containing protein n=1 Tax=Portunus trituberculatus TaxID=210409 RepID=A0A5B7IQS9_PORTR|nr:hypothetical protein [Portunus trituberculatus]
MEHILSLYPFTEISIPGDFNVHHHLWLSSLFTDHPGSPKVEVSLAFYLCQMGYYADFPWNDYCFRVRDPSLCAERIAEVIVSGMEAYIPHSFS